MKDFCKDDIEKTNGQLLYGGNIYIQQISCRANTQNAGNYYSWVSGVAGGTKSSGVESNSICPKNWQLSLSTTFSGGYYNLIHSAYNLWDNSDINVRNLPLSFVRTGLYYEDKLSYRGASGHYTTNTSDDSTHIRYFKIGEKVLDTSFYNYNENRKYNGYSLRCIDKMGFVRNLLDFGYGFAYNRGYEI